MHAATATTLSDEPEGICSASPIDRPEIAPPFAPTYAEQVALWRGAEDLNVWIAAQFGYDMDRAIALSASRRAEAKSISIYAPDEFYRKKTGICVDLSRFAVESLREIAPESQPQYLMIDFEPIRVNGHLFQKHWLASFTRNGEYYFFADSKRPGFISGPYKLPEIFIAEYEQFRRRSVVSFTLVSTYEKRRRQLRAKKQRKKAVR